MPPATTARLSQPTSFVGAALILVGFTAVIAQIILMREFIVIFGGNELSLGIMLAAWLLWTAAGSALASRLVLGRNNARKTVAVLECLLAISLLPTVWILRIARTFFQTVPGELAGPAPMLLTSVICLSAVCAFSGCLFVVVARMYENEWTVSSGVATSSAYLLEAAGSALGGILASFVLLRFLESFQIAGVIALLNLGMAAILLFTTNRTQVATAILVTLGLSIPLLFYVGPSLDRSAQQRLWQGFRVLGSRDSIYGNLVVTETGTIRSIYDNGAILASAPDPNAAEEAVHYALLEHPAPKRILLIGGGLNGSVVEALKHPSVDRIDHVELDPALIHLFRQFFSALAIPSMSDPRVHIHYADGRHYLRTTGDTFDVIILNLPDPQTAQLNRFYTVEFFRSARSHLAASGLLALQLRASEDHISTNLADFLRCIQHTLKQVFSDVVIIPGDPIHFFASPRSRILTDDPQTLLSRLKSRHLQTQYVREYFIPFRMMPDRMVQARTLLQPLPATPVNRDFEPIAYYFSVAHWSAQFGSGYSRLFQAAANIAFTPVIGFALVTLLLAVILLAYIPARQRRAPISAACCVGATGFTLMALQILVLLAFQSVYGYVYHQLAILIGMFMGGISLGGWLGITRTRTSARNSPLAVAGAIQFLLALSGFVLLSLVSLLSRSASVHGALLVAQLVFPALAMLCGLLGGYQFPVATEIYLPGRHSQRGMGLLYAVDLLGGCIGALLLSTYLIPVFGFWKVAWLLLAVNLAPGFLALQVSRDLRTSQV